MFSLYSNFQCTLFQKRTIKSTMKIISDSGKLDLIQYTIKNMKLKEAAKIPNTRLNFLPYIFFPIYFYEMTGMNERLFRYVHLLNVLCTRTRTKQRVNTDN